MEKNILEKDLIFYKPGESGSIFTYKAGHLVDGDLILEAKNHLEYDVEGSVDFVVDRRNKPRGSSMAL